MSKVLTINVHDLGSINPNELKGWFFPNWYDKDHFEDFLGKKISKKDFEEFKEFLVDKTGIHDEVSNMMSEYVNDFYEDFKDYQKDK